MAVRIIKAWINITWLKLAIITRISWNRLYFLTLYIRQYIFDYIFFSRWSIFKECFSRILAISCCLYHYDIGYMTFKHIRVYNLLDRNNFVVQPNFSRNSYKFLHANSRADHMVFHCNFFLIDDWKGFCDWFEVTFWTWKPSKAVTFIMFIVDPSTRSIIFARMIFAGICSVNFSRIRNN